MHGCIECVTDVEPGLTLSWRHSRSAPLYVSRLNPTLTVVIVVACTLSDGVCRLQGSVKKVEQAKVVVFACGLEASSTETKGTVLIRTGEELMSYNKVARDTVCSSFLLDAL